MKYRSVGIDSRSYWRLLSYYSALPKPPTSDIGYLQSTFVPPQTLIIIPRHGVAVIVMVMIAVDEYVKDDDLPFCFPDETLIFPPSEQFNNTDTMFVLPPKVYRVVTFSLFIL